MLFATDIVFVSETWLRKGKWHLILVKVGGELGCGENLCLRGLLSDFKLIIPKGEIEPEVPADIYLFTCLDGCGELV